ncbi:MAG: hypothetical protein COT84_06980 [Chlamydiae bacterium CG10_big_fil_rev_8_21_14_0_10_35_9]|nr:MAG: hypothetical protein COT84_06980 [Chlamydiae bacterium CG10_big_fil_rev_8_21_14_0_10_35_9]
MQIQSALNNVQTFNELLPIAERATSHISFFGSRYVTVRGYEGFLEIDALIEKVEEIIARKPLWSEETRSAGKRVLLEKSRLYSQYYKKKKNCNWITWIFLLARTGFIWEEGRTRRTYFNVKIVPLFDVTRIEYVGDTEYDPERGFRYIDVLEHYDYHNDNWMPDPAHVRISSTPISFLESGITVPCTWEYC